MLNKIELQQGVSVAKEGTMGFVSFPIHLLDVALDCEKRDKSSPSNAWKSVKSIVKLLDCVCVGVA